MSRYKVESCRQVKTYVIVFYEYLYIIVLLSKIESVHALIYGGC